MTAHIKTVKYDRTKNKALQARIILAKERLPMAASRLSCAETATTREQQSRYVDGFVKDLKAIITSLESVEQ